MVEQNFCHGQWGWDSRFSLKGTGATYAPDRTFDTEHICLKLKIDIARERFVGHCQTVLRAITNDAQEMVFDAVNFKIIKVLWNGRSNPFQYRDGKLKIQRPSPVAEGTKVLVDVFYEVARPKLGLYFIKPNRFYPKRPTQVWTQGEDEYARYWFPCHDAPHERTTTEVYATVPAGFTAVSNGRLVGTTHSRGSQTSTFHYKQDIPHATYLVTLTVGRFQVLRDKWKNVPVVYYCEKGREEETRRAFGKTPKMLEFFSRFTRTRYPYAKYAQIAAADFIYGGMENTSATTQTDAALLDERVSLDYSSDELVAHELAHQWFGDYLTCKDWSHAWLNESFATYFDALFKRDDKGEDEFLYAVHANSEIYLQEDRDHYRRPIVTKMFRRPSDLFDRHLYEKGSVVLYMLHRWLGEDLFQKSIALYVRRNRGRVVETLDLINAIEEATGRNVRRFFDQWVFGAGHPELKVRTWWDSRKKELKVRVTQTHNPTPETGLFSLSTGILVVSGRQEKYFPLLIDKKSQLFSFPWSREPDLIQFDPHHVLLKKLDFPKPERMFIHQLFKSKNVLSRCEAAQALGRSGSRTAVEALKKVLLSDSFWGVRAEVARALGQIGSDAASLVLIHSLDVVDHPKVRRAIYAALKSFKNPSIAKEIELRYSSEASYFAEAEGLRALGALGHPKAGELLKAALKKDSWNDVIRGAALEGLAATRSREWIPLFLSYTRPGHHQKLRLTALRCLAQYETESDRIQPAILKLISDPFPLMQIGAVRVLHQLGDERAVPALKNLTLGDRDGRLKRLAEEAIEKIQKGFE